MTPANIGRNDQCPCGSGRKFKRCCAERFFAIATPSGMFRGLIDCGECGEPMASVDGFYVCSSDLPAEVLIASGYAVWPSDAHDQGFGFGVPECPCCIDARHFKVSAGLLWSMGIDVNRVESLIALYATPNDTDAPRGLA